MHVKNLAIRLSFSLAALAIVVPLVNTVNHFAYISHEAGKTRTLQADGAPLPPPPPLAKPTVADTSSALTADGAPLPPPPPLTKLQGTSASSALIADGAPLPPPPPLDAVTANFQLSV